MGNVLSFEQAYSRRICDEQSVAVSEVLATCEPEDPEIGWQPSDVFDIITRLCQAMCLGREAIDECVECWQENTIDNAEHRAFGALADWVMHAPTSSQK